MAAVALSPKAGAHGELCGLLCIRAAIEAKGESRPIVLVPESAHGTNPATAAFAGFKVESIPATEDGRVDMAALISRLGPDVAGVMITNPNTCGLFERDLKTISDAVHAAGGYVYCDGANFNAIVGKVRPGDLGVDAMHINLHKTFSTPMVVAVRVRVRWCCRLWRPSRRCPSCSVRPMARVHLVEEEEIASTGHAQSFGRMAAFHGQMGMFTRALTYILSHGNDGLRQVSEDAVLNANYILRALEDVLEAPFAKAGPACTRRCSRTPICRGFSTLDIAKGLIDEGFHPMTVYFPLVVHGAMLIEPTETESRAGLDRFIASMRSLAERARPVTNA
jgi:glycine dehydrogenase subunit 2